jgi:plasmid stability protein
MVYLFVEGNFMPTLYVRNFPEDLLRRVKELANQRQRSLSAEVVTLIDKALQTEPLRERRAQVLADIAKHRRSFRTPAGAADSLTLLREDRRR